MLENKTNKQYIPLVEMSPSIVLQSWRKSQSSFRFLNCPKLAVKIIGCCRQGNSFGDFLLDLKGSGTILIAYWLSLDAPFSFTCPPGLPLALFALLALACKQIGNRRLMRNIFNESRPHLNQFPDRWRSPWGSSEHHGGLESHGTLAPPSSWCPLALGPSPKLDLHT